MITPKLETERLLLREIQYTDIDAIFNCWMQDEKVSRYMWWKASDDINEAKEFVEFEMGNLENDSWNRWIIVLKETSEIIGTCLIFFNDDEDHWDISYNFGRKFWGKGYATEAMTRVMRYAVEIMNITEISTTYAVENTASGRVLEKLGFQNEKEISYECNGGDIVTTGRLCRYTCENEPENMLVTEYASVRYIEDDKIVLLTWKKPAYLENYRKPTTFALELLRKYDGSNFIIDARHGFEDDKRDVEWGFSWLLPEMSKTSCRFVSFIMNSKNDIEDEMDMWTVEFGKYFAVTRAQDYEEAKATINNYIMVKVRYGIKAGKRAEFVDKLTEAGITEAIES